MLLHVTYYTLSSSSLFPLHNCHQVLCFREAFQQPGISQHNFKSRGRGQCVMFHVFFFLSVCTLLTAQSFHFSAPTQTDGHRFILRNHILMLPVLVCRIQTSLPKIDANTCFYVPVAFRSILEKFLLKALTISQYLHITIDCPMM